MVAPAGGGVIRTEVVTEIPDAESMRALGRQVAGLLRAGDLVVLGGELGAGKTTLAQGIGAGLGVRGPITSPTFVIARVHPALAGGPPLVHVDAYRIASWDELEDLDLEATLDEAVTLVEWGDGLAEGLAPARLEIGIHRTFGAVTDQNGTPTAEARFDVRQVILAGVGDRWARVDLGAALGVTAT